MNIVIKRVPVKKFPFTTLGHWFEKENTIHFLIAKMSDWRFEVAVLFHEMTEYFVCKSLGIGTKVCDEWDNYYEKQYKLGKIPKSKEAGDDKRCPYYKGHQLGNKFERRIILALGASWKKYLKECNELMEV